MNRMADLERIYVIPLRGAYEGVRTKRSRKAIKVIRSFISKHMKAELDDVVISQAVNSTVWKRGIQKPPRKIKVKAVKSGDKVSVMLLDEKEVPKAPAKAAPKKEEKPKEEPKAEEKAAPVKEEVVEKVEEKVEVTTLPQEKKEEKPAPAAKVEEKPKEEPKAEEKKE